jgi:hypothetical protein
MASELAWSEDRVREEVSEVREEFLLHHSVSEPLKVART